VEKKTSARISVFQQWVQLYGCWGKKNLIKRYVLIFPCFLGFLSRRNISRMGGAQKSIQTVDIIIYLSF
jgi:hypothetical protein